MRWPSFSGRRSRSEVARRSALVVGLAVLSIAAGPDGPQAIAASTDGAKGASSSCEAANALLDLGHVAAAEEAYEKALGGKPSPGCAKAGLQRLGKSECAAGEALLESGEGAEAQKAFVETLKAKPSSVCAVAGIEDASEPSLWDELGTISADALTALGFFTLALVALGLVGLLLVNLLAAIPWTRRWRPVAAIVRPAVSVEAFDDSGLKDIKLGAGTAALLREKIELGSGHDALKLVSGGTTAAETWIAKVSEIGDQGQVAGAVLGLVYLLLPRRHVKVTGTLQPAAEPTGSGVSLELHQEVDSRGSATLWASRFSLPHDESVAVMHQLMTPAAAWVSHSVTTATGGKAVAASDPMSWALFKSGIELQRKGELQAAVRDYLEALALDTRNYGALTNLALIEAGAGNYMTAMPKLREALVILETLESEQT